MEVAVNHWNEAEKEAEELGFQRKRVLQRSSTSTSTSTSSEKDTEGGEGTIEFNNESETTQKLDVATTQKINGKMILQDAGEIEENNTILPVSDPPIIIPEIISTSLNNIVTLPNEITTVSIVRENEDYGRQELYLEKVYEKPPTHGFYCPNCRTCIQTVYIIKGEWQQQQQQKVTSSIATPISEHVQVQPKPNEPIRCSSCFSFLIPIGSWLFPGWVPDKDGEFNDQDTTGSSNNNRLPEQSHTLKGASQQEDPKHDQSTKESHSGTKDTSKQGIKIEEDSGKNPKIIENTALIGSGTGPNKVSGEVNDEINGTGPGNNIASQDSLNQSSVTSQDHQGGQVAQGKKKKNWYKWEIIGGGSDALSIPKKPVVDSPKIIDWKVISDAPHTTIVPKQPKIEPDLVEIKVDGGSTEQEEQPVPDINTPLLSRREPHLASNRSWEILKSVVHGGLTESLASLSVVTSAASADATTLSIVALAIANLIGGLFALGHNLGELKAEKPKTSENETEPQVDRYNELLGHRENFYLHAFIAILSFIVFGLVPPIVYGFSFRESDEKDYKLAAVAVASLLCITLLSIAKAYIKRPNNYVTYFQTVLYYVSTGAVASVLSYLAGQMVNRAMEKFGWFNEPATLFNILSNDV